MTPSGWGHAVSDILGPARQQVNHGTISVLRTEDSVSVVYTHDKTEQNSGQKTDLIQCGYYLA